MTDDNEYTTAEDYALASLGEPERRFRVSVQRFWAKFLLGIGLLAYGILGNYLAWRWGVWRFEHIHIIVIVLIAPPFTGLSILSNLIAARGLEIWIYAHGVLWMQRNHVVSIPWVDLAHVVLLAEQATLTPVLDHAGRAVGVDVVVVSPRLRIDRASITLTRNDQEEIRVNAAIEDYPELVLELMNRSIPTLMSAWAAETKAISMSREPSKTELEAETSEQSQTPLDSPELQVRLSERAFGKWRANDQGIRPSESARMIPWASVQSFEVKQKQLGFTYLDGKKEKTEAYELELIQNPHLLILLWRQQQPSQSMSSL